MENFDRRRAAILDTAEQIFAREGFGAAAMRDVARAAGISVAGLYYYLPSKQDALRLICARAFDALAGALEQSLKSASDHAHRLRAFARSHLTFIVEHPSAFRVLLRDADALESLGREDIAARRRTYFDSVNELVAAASGSEHQATRVLTASLFGMLNWTPMWYRVGQDGDAVHLADKMVSVFLDGACRSGALLEIAS
jgi:AcrR family transcriptional regulator